MAANDDLTWNAGAFFPKRKTLPALREASKVCRACPLFRTGTVTVFGEGAAGARLMLVGEQPGDQEDRKGRPFVGPAGRILDRALARAGIARDDAYVTNVVKHFKWVPRGKRRLHDKPSTREIGACLPWLSAEIEVVRPVVIVCLGASAARALLGRDFRVTRDRGKVRESELAPYLMATVHPSSILRSRTDEERHAAMDRFVLDLARVAPLLAEAERLRRPGP
jgi:DNA polymerase